MTNRSYVSALFIINAKFIFHLCEYTVMWSMFLQQLGKKNEQKNIRVKKFIIMQNKKQTQTYRKTLTGSLRNP